MLCSRHVGALAAVALFTANAAAEDPKTPIERVEAMQKDLQTKFVQMQNELAGLKSRIEALDGNRVTWVESADIRLKLEELLTEMAQLRVELGVGPKPPAAPGARRMPLGKSESARPDYGRPDAGRPDYGRPDAGRVDARRIAFGIVRLQNDFPVAQEIFVNGQPHIVWPGFHLDVPVPAGEFSFQVMSRDPAPRVRAVPPGLVYTAHIHP